jgi:hypothetical protein
MDKVVEIGPLTANWIPIQLQIRQRRQLWDFIQEKLEGAKIQAQATVSDAK